MDKEYSKLTLGSRAVAGAKWTLMGQGSRLATQLLGIVILARILSPEEYGLFGIVAAITGFAAAIGDFGLSAASIQAREITSRQRSNLFWINTSIGLIAALVLTVLAKPIGDFYGQPAATPLVYALSINFLLMSLTTQFSANVARDMRFRLLATSEIIGPMAGLILAVTSALVGLGVWSLVVQQLVTSLVILLLLAIVGRWVPSLPGKAPMRGLLAFGSKAFAVQLLNYASTNIGSIFLGKFHGVQQVGLYDRAYQIFRMPTQQLATPLTRVMLPLLSRNQDNVLVMTKYLAKAELILAYAIGGVMVAMACLSDLVVLVALGPGWDAAAAVLSILCIGGYFQGLGYILQWGFMSTGRVGLQLSFSIVTRVIMIALVLVAVPFGMNGIAVAVSLGLVVNWVVLFSVALPRTGIQTRDLVGGVIRPLGVHISIAIACFTSRWVTTWLGSHQWITWITVMLVGIVGYLLFGLAVARVRQDIRESVTLMRGRSAS